MHYKRSDEKTWQPDSDRFDAVLQAGFNRVIVEVAAPRDKRAFHLRFRRKAESVEHESLIQAALAQSGDAERGRKVFFDEARAQCSRCHRLGDRGERIGPELTGIGSRFPRIHLIESILDPSRNVAPGFQTLALTLADGKVQTGIKVSETEQTITVADNQGKLHLIRRPDIEEAALTSTSTMPDGLTKQLTQAEFIDLITFLVNQVEPAAGAAGR
jgi:putative heme-binding domain-containing protein